jgi:hypothetical protein
MAKTQIVVALILMLFVVGCTSQYALQAFCFPPGSKPHEDNWEYLGMIVTETSSPGSMFAKNPKHVKIRIQDKNKRSLLDDNYDFSCGYVKANISWDTFDVLVVKLVETDSEHFVDAYSQKLGEPEPQPLVDLKYRYNQETKKFERTN